MAKFEEEKLHLTAHTGAKIKLVLNSKCSQLFLTGSSALTSFLLHKKDWTVNMAHHSLDKWTERMYGGGEKNRVGKLEPLLSTSATILLLMILYATFHIF